MKNICVTKSSDKLNSNLPYYTDSINLYEVDLSSNSIYKTYYSFQHKIDTFIFNLSKINNEIVSFISDFKNNHKYVIYVDTDNSKILETIKDFECQYIIKNNINIHIDNSYKLPELIINDKLYGNLDAKVQKINQAVYFLDNKISIPDNLNNILYPNTKIPVKMFNNSDIHHCQLVGYVNESDRKDLLLESLIYLYSDDLYNVEASLCGCKLINVSKIDKDAKTIENITKHADSETYEKYTTYNNFIQEFLL